MVRFRLLGPIARFTGYGVGFRGLCRRLAAYPDLDFQLRAMKDSVPNDTEPELLRLIEKNGYYDCLGVVVGFPPACDDICSRYTTLYSMYEADDIPEDWKRYVSRMDEVWVPTTFCARVFGQYTKRIRICPWGIDETVYRKGKLTPHEDFVFGAVGVQSPRKGTDVLVKAFEMAFRRRPGVRLVIKTRDTRKMPVIDNPQVTVIDEDWPEERLVAFYRGIDCLVEPSRGEGLGMPPLQAAMCGVPAIATNWSGPADYIDDKGIWGLRIVGLSRADSIGAKGANWAEPDVRHLAELMERMVDEKPVVRGDYSKWTLKNMARTFYQYLGDTARRMQS